MPALTVCTGSPGSMLRMPFLAIVLVCLHICADAGRIRHHAASTAKRLGRIAESQEEVKVDLQDGIQDELADKDEDENEDEDEDALADALGEAVQDELDDEGQVQDEGPRGKRRGGRGRGRKSQSRNSESASRKSGRKSRGRKSRGKRSPGGAIPSYNATAEFLSFKASDKKGYSTIDRKQIQDILASMPKLRTEDNLVFNVLTFLEQDKTEMQKFPSIEGACVYAPGDETRDILMGLLEASKQDLATVLAAGTFEPIDGKCPSQLDGNKHKEVTSKGGSKFKPCPGAEDGFLSSDGNCVAARKTVGSQTRNVTMFQLEGFFGFDSSMAAIIKIHTQSAKLGKTNRVQTLPAGAKGREGRTLTLPLHFVVCDQRPSGKISTMVTKDVLKKQVDLLNKDFGGTDGCPGYTSYKPPQEDTGIQFTFNPDADLEYKTDSRCSSKDYEDLLNWTKITRELAPLKKGKIVVWVGHLGKGYAGLAGFPGSEKAGRRKIYLDFRCLPGLEKGSRYESHCSGSDVLAHELGHYFGLFHTFQGGCDGAGDLVSDTLATKSKWVQCPTSDEEALTSECGEPEPVHNFMSYIGDDCSCSFTKGQVKRMWSTMPKEYLNKAFSPKRKSYAEEAPR